MAQGSITIKLQAVPLGSSFVAQRRQHMPHDKMNEEKVRQIIKYGLKHMEFCVRVCRWQMKEKRYFVYEIPDNAYAWKVAMMVEQCNLHQ